jgi:hypothetical protein
MLGAGTVINPIIKIVTTVAILAAVYILVLKPVLDTTDKAFDSVSDSVTGFDDLSAGIQSQVDDALDSTGNPDRLRACIQRAIDEGASQRAIDRCLDRFG